jgi:hypothetical protein
MNKIHYFVIFLLSINLYSCKPKKTDPATVDLGFDFSPLESGRYNIYEVDATLFTVLGKEYERYQVKEIIKDTIQIGNETVYRLERFYRDSPDQPWPFQPDSVWTIRKNNFQLIKTENNFRYIKLVFPIEEGKTWDGNALNTLFAENYKMSNIDKPYQVNEHYFPKTLTVFHKSDSSLLGKDLRLEVFARDIGLVYKKIEKIEYKNESGSIGTDTTGGLLYYQKFIEHGKE